MSDLIRRAKADCFKRHVSTGKCLVCELTDALEAKDKRIAELEADLKDYATAIGQNEQLRKENKRLRAALESIVGQTDDQFFEGVWREVNTTAREALAAVEGEGDGS